LSGLTVSGLTRVDFQDFMLKVKISWNFSRSETQKLKLSQAFLLANFGVPKLNCKNNIFYELSLTKTLKNQNNIRLLKFSDTIVRYTSFGLDYKS
jgi:hypothetical protein